MTVPTAPTGKHDKIARGIRDVISKSPVSNVLSPSTYNRLFTPIDQLLQFELSKFIEALSPPPYSYPL